MISREPIFIRIPKTGSTTLTKLVGGKHTHETALLRRQKTPPEKWKRAFKFVFVRNPWDHTVSYYEYYRSYIQKKQGFDNFTDWVQGGCRSTWQVDWVTPEQPNDPLNQLLFFRDLKEKWIVDFVGAYENLNEDAHYVMRQLGRIGSHQPLEVPWLNKTNHRIHRDYRKYYNTYTKRIIEKKNAEFINIFGYTF